MLLLPCNNNFLDVAACLTSHPVYLLCALHNRLYMQAAELLSGTWKLAYTANSELLPLLGLARLPLTRVGDITQVIDASNGTFQNKVIFSSHTPTAAHM